jgi:hypothetical protein
MNPVLGWALAALFVAVAWRQYGWQGVGFAASVIVFWLLLQFTRAMRVMKKAASAPVGHVDSAVMLNARLRTGMPMIQVVPLTRSLGRKVSDDPETWAWRDEGGSSVTLVFDKGRLASWTLDRPPEASPPAP